MGPYCKFCNDRCFRPTTQKDPILTDLMATCKEGRVFDLVKTVEKVQARLDHALSECFTEFEMQPLEREWTRLMDLIKELES